jgi:predicted nucleotidyltransferase
MGAASQYFGLKGALEEMFSRPVDLIVESAIDNQYLKKSIESSAWTLYAA